jgi:DNA-directed RNA polymerase specialized sigma24 family protein
MGLARGRGGPRWREEPLDSLLVEPVAPETEISPDVAAILADLTPRYRLAVLCLASGWSRPETADFLGVSTSRLDRMMFRLAAEPALISLRESERS